MCRINFSDGTGRRACRELLRGSEYDGVSAKVMAMATGFEMLTEQLKRQLMHEYPEVLTPGIWAFRDNAVVSVYRFRSTAVPASAACACWYMRVNTPMCLRNCPAQMVHDRRMKTLTFLVNDSPPVTVPNVSNHARSDPFCSSPFISLYPFAPLSLCPPFIFLGRKEWQAQPALPGPHSA